ncbi:ABC transporter permease subunit [Heliorestis acidaminivorans]|nr:ABC transporter permease subunit [Heliorestis acidaminivorans]
MARLTFLEGSRKKVFLITLLLSLVFLLLYGLALEFASREMLRLDVAGPQQVMIQQIIGHQLLGSGLYFASFILALLALLASVGSIASEIENGLMHAVVSKPIKRWEIVLGKFLGYTGMLIGYALLLYVGVIAINRLYNPLALTLAGPESIFYSALLFVWQPVVLLALALLLSTLLRTITAGIVAVLLYGLGSIGGFLEQIGSMVARADLLNIGIAISLFMPNDALYRKMLATVTTTDGNPLQAMTVGPFGISMPPTNAMVWYTLFYVILCLALAVYTFQKRDL